MSDTIFVVWQHDRDYPDTNAQILAAFTELPAALAFQDRCVEEDKYLGFVVEEVLLNPASHPAGSGEPLTRLSELRKIYAQADKQRDPSLWP